MSNRDIGVEILDGISEIKAFKRGNSSLKTTELSEPSEPKIIRALLKLLAQSEQDIELGKTVSAKEAFDLLRNCSGLEKNS